MKQIFSTFWHGKALSPLHWACLKSYIDRGHEMRVYCYLPVEVPKGVVLHDAAALIDESEVFEFENSFSGFSNIFRYKLLLREGCWWVDTDMYCLVDDVPDCGYAWARQDQGSINGAILKFPAGDPTLQSILLAAEQIGRGIKVWGKLGPDLLTSHLKDKSFPDVFGSTQTCYPIHWLEAFRLWLPGHQEAVWAQTKGALFLHFWESMFRRFGIDVRLAPPKGSVLAAIYENSGYPFPLPEAPPEAYQKAYDSIRKVLTQFREHSKWALGYDLLARAQQERWLDAVEGR